jgi:hypothetical protein
MRRFTFFLVAFAATAGLAAFLGPVPSHADGQSAAYLTDIPPGIATGSGSPRPMRQAT